MLDVNPNLPEPVLLVGGPVNGRRTRLSKQQVDNGYEFVDISGYYDSTWRSAKYKRLTKIGTTTIMVHESVTAEWAWKFAEELEDVKKKLSTAAETSTKNNTRILELERENKEVTR